MLELEDSRHKTSPPWSNIQSPPLYCSLMTYMWLLYIDNKYTLHFSFYLGSFQIKIVVSRIKEMVKSMEDITNLYKGTCQYI